MKDLRLGFWSRCGAVAALALSGFLGGCSAPAATHSDAGLPPIDAPLGSGGTAGGNGGTGGGSGTGGRGGSSAPVTDAGTGGRPSSLDARDASVGEAGPTPQDQPGIFVGVGYGGRRIRSADDGLTWTDDASLSPAGGDDDTLLRTVVWGNQQFVAIGYRVMTSPDGRQWVDHGVNALNQWVGAMVYAPGIYVAVGGYGLRASSTDGLTWAEHAIDTVPSHPPDAIVYTADFGGRFVSANDDGKRSFSSDGRTWTFSTGALTTIATLVAYGNGIFVGLDGTSVTVSLDGGLTWSDAASLGTPGLAIVYGQGQFVVLGSGHVFTSPDIQAWRDQPVSGLASEVMTYGHGTYIAFSGTSLRRSKDARTWDPAISVGGANSVSRLAFAPMP